MTGTHSAMPPQHTEAGRARHVRAALLAIWPGLLLLADLFAGAGVNNLVMWTSMGWAFWCTLTVARHRDPARPLPPVRPQAPLPWVRSEPPRVVPVVAYNCIICGRPLTNPQSMLARVGSTCIRTYGPRPAWQPNADHDRWAEELAHARALQAEAQVRLDRDHAAVLADMPRRVRAWEEELASPSGLARKARRQRAWRVLGTASGWAALVAVIP